jgi:hypothetical protein
MDDWTKLEADAPPTSPHEGAERDEAAAAQGRGDQASWQAVDHGWEKSLFPKEE